MRHLHEETLRLGVDPERIRRACRGHSVPWSAAGQDDGLAAGWGCPVRATFALHRHLLP
ncbi:MAG: hypothetical protein R3A10_02175 [Caldilineaceae bacterium]